MSLVKDDITKFVLEQTDDSSYAEIVRELVFRRIIEQGLRDSDDGRVISNEELKHRIKLW